MLVYNSVQSICKLQTVGMQYRQVPIYTCKASALATAFGMIDVDLV